MIDCKAALIAYLKSIGPVVDLMAVRWSPEESPEDYDFPRGTYQLISYVEPLYLTGAIGFAVARITLKVWGESSRQGYKTTNTVFAALRDCLHGYRGRMGAAFVQMCSLENLQDAGEPPAPGLAKGNSCASLDVILKFDQDVPALPGA